MPNDDLEYLQHHLFTLTLGDRLGLAPPNDPDSKVNRVLDVGTGTGIWAVDFGDEHPEAKVIGVDLSPIQPSFVPPNVEFFVDDIEEPWSFSEPFDYVHSRMMTFSIKSWPEYIRNIYDHLSPGGYVELVEIDLYGKSDDGTLKEHHELSRLVRLLDEASTKIGRKFQDNKKNKDILRDTGFVDIVETTFKWPTGPWPKDKKFKELGQWYNANMDEFQGLESLAMAALTRVLGWTKEEVVVHLALVRKEMADKSLHAYWPIYSTYGRRPLELPTRLLDILAGDGGSIKLHETREEEKDMYIALSHCWGPNGLPDEAKTTNATKEDRKRGIRIDDLPKSFQDAITICHALGIRYLWIDSICIIQQDKDDWEKECSRMRDVYRNSYLTISVARSRDSSEGCFSSRPSKHLSTKIGSINHQGQVYDIKARESIKHYEVVGSDSPNSNFPLFSRAWTFQERLLPQRVVHYGETELIWECNSLCDCECAASRDFLTPWAWEKSPKVMFSNMMNLPRHGPEFRRNWAALMRRFSLMQLSFDADRLPSLSGLAQELQCDETGSWSWTSVENIWVSWNYSVDLSAHDVWTTEWPNGRDLTEHNDAFKIVQCTVQSKDYSTLGEHDAFGQVSSGTLIIFGRLISAVLRDDFFCERNTIKQRFSPDVRGEPGLYIAGQQVHCLMIGAMSTQSSKYPGLVTVSSLILRPREGDSKGRCTYERIGLMSQNNHFAWKETPAWWEDAESAVVEIT
ncbi:hypothetical protein Neosp_003202 [[Neocosmospora] mangrovei]